ncbi:hypothetical protein [Paractinoplanes deccanensis]|uniref:hypothetical protein n=1 Tax=Paractinoplanes deccanensis TaxID=113561 RepID=UPI001941ADA6|nr:hypothetical protein [Actinoplanes deccanensis]
MTRVRGVRERFLRFKGAGPYRSTWASHDDYLNDLLAFQLHAMNFDAQYGAEVEARESWLATGEDVVEAVNRQRLCGAGEGAR